MKPSFMKRFMHLPIRYAGKILNPLLHHIECGLLGRGEGPLKYPPLFIVGAPRCGSTLLYQIMLDYFDLGYITNLHCRLFGAPSVAERVLRPSSRRGPSAYKSDHGRVAGWSSPSECGDYWYRFFRRRPQHVPLAATDSGSLRNLRRSMRAIGRAMRRPLLFKNLLSGLRLEPIMKALPEATFIVVHRDLLDTAHSILEARMNLYGDHGKWFSVEPPEIDSLMSRPVPEQVVEQVRGIYATIERDRRGAAERFLDIDYEALCRDTHAVLNAIAAFLDKRGVDVRGRGEVPGSFEVKRTVRIDRDLYARVREYIERTSGRSGSAPRETAG